MINILYQLIRTARPRQWLKNLAVFAPAFFSGLLFIKKTNLVMGKLIFEKEVFAFPTETLLLSTKAFFAFCLLSSATYFMNDIVDANKDALHPIKKNRPIPSGKLSKKLATAVALILAIAGMAYALIAVNKYFAAICAVYLVMQICYSFYFRQVIILESLIVASGFILRVFAGGLASYSSISSWVLLTTMGLALLVAFGKRRSEKTILTQQVQNQGLQQQTETRATLRHYPDSLLDSMISVSASFCLISYALFTFQAQTQELKVNVSRLLPTFPTTPKIMMITIPIVIYGIARYLYVIYEKKDAESPERVLLSDRPLTATVVLWGVVTFLIIYVFHNYLTQLIS